MPRLFKRAFKQSFEPDIHAAVFLILLAALFYTAFSTLIRLVSRDASFGQILFVRFVPTLLGFLLISPRLGFSFFKVKKPLPYLARCILGAASIMAFTYALMNIPLSDAILLANTAPLFAPLMAYLFFGITTKLSVWLSIFIGFIGVGLILNPSNLSFSLGELAGISSGACAALAILYVRQISKEHSVWQIIFYNYLSGSLLSLCFNPLKTFPTHPKILLIFLGIFIFSLLYQIFMTFAYAKAPVRYISPLMYTTVILGFIIDYTLFGTSIKAEAYWGTMLIIGGGIATILLGKKHLIKQD